MVYFELDTKESQTNYKLHMENLSNRYPKALYKAFVDCDRFHDYYLKSLTLNCDSVLYKKQHNKICITLFSDICNKEDYLTIEFDEIISFNFDTDYYCKYGEYFLKTIYFAELNITNENIFSFEFIVSDGPRFYVEFKKCRILEGKKPKNFIV